MTLQLTRDSAFSRGFMSARSVMGFLSDVYPTAADEIGKIHIIADDRVCIDTVILLYFYASVPLGLFNTKSVIWLTYRFRELFLIFRRRLQRSC